MGRRVPVYESFLPRHLDRSGEATLTMSLRGATITSVVVKYRDEKTDLGTALEEWITPHNCKMQR